MKNDSGTKRKRASHKEPRSRDKRSTKSKSMGFQIEHHNNLTGFQKLAYIAQEVGVSWDEIATIIEENPAVVRETLDNGSTPAHTTNAQEVLDKLYQVRMLFSSLLRLCRYSNTEVNRLLSDRTEFAQCTKQPPWYPGTLKNYIRQGKTAAVSNALIWLKSY